MQIFFGIKRPKAFIENSILREDPEYQRLYDSLPDATTPEILASNRAILKEYRDRVMPKHPRWPEVEAERKMDAEREAKGEFNNQEPPPLRILP